MVLTSDVVDNINDIHPKMKKEVGERLADVALGETYGRRNMVYQIPMYKNMQVEKNKIRVWFSNAEKGLMSKGPITEFFVAGADKNFVPAEAKIEGNSIVIWNKTLAQPIAVRYGFSNSATLHLYNKEGVPLNLFRTDDWPVEIILNKK